MQNILTLTAPTGTHQRPADPRRFGHAGHPRWRPLGWLLLALALLPLTGRAQAPTLTSRTLARNAIATSRSADLSLAFYQALNPATGGQRARRRPWRGVWGSATGHRCSPRAVTSLPRPA